MIWPLSRDLYQLTDTWTRRHYISILFHFSAGGLVTAVAPVVIKGNGLWVGWPGIHLEEPIDNIPESDPNDQTPTAGLRSDQVIWQVRLEEEGRGGWVSDQRSRQLFRFVFWAKIASGNDPKKMPIQINPSETGLPLHYRTTNERLWLPAYFQ